MSVPVHGTYQGYQWHTHNKVPPCEACRRAASAYAREYRRQGRDRWLRGRGYGTTCVAGLGWPR